MKNIKDPKLDRKVEEAIKFLVFEMIKSCHNFGKPVILHSIRTGLRLYNLGYDKDVVIAAILHDVVEDSDVTLKEVKSKFGKEIAELVDANSMNEEIDDKLECYRDNFTRCLKKGKKALIIKAADILDNSNYYHLATDEIEKKCMWKWKYFIDISKKVIGDEPIYRELSKNFKLASKS